MLKRLISRIKQSRNPIQYWRDKGVTIGDNCVIGAGAVVTKSIPANSVAAGVPARVIQTIEEYKKKNMDRFVRTKGMTSERKKIILVRIVIEVTEYGNKIVALRRDCA